MQPKRKGVRNMDKLFVGFGVVWLGIALVLGNVWVVQSLKSDMKAPNTESEQTLALDMSPTISTETNDQVSAMVQIPNTGLKAEVSIK